LGLLFHVENQGNFSRAVLLGQGADPPVVFGWIGRPPWVLYAERFSDCVFAQVFDWQYQFKFGPGDDDKEIAPTAVVRLRTRRAPAVLRQHFAELVGTQFVVEGVRYDEYRFWRSPVERLTVAVPEDDGTQIFITGAYPAILALEADVLELLSADVRPADFSSMMHAANYLAVAIDQMEHGRLARLRHACRLPPSPQALHRLVACHRETSLRDRLRDQQLPYTPQDTSLGGLEWGVTIRLRPGQTGRWQLDEIALA
jgi:hypothetical protein